jgi:hypothetical protein
MGDLIKYRVPVATGLTSLGAPVMTLAAVSGGTATAAVILGSIVFPLVAVGWLCWFFWRHRHDE